jgi:hypothetical protein
VTGVDHVTSSNIPLVVIAARRGDQNIVRTACSRRCLLVGIPIFIFVITGHARVAYPAI